jgi:DNA-binding MarR family transcriptional regulator
MTDTLFRDKPGGRAADSRANVRLWLRLLGCSTVVEKRVRSRLAKLGATLPRFDVMAALERHPEGMTMSQLSRLLLVSNGNVTGLVQSLAKDGLVGIAPSSSDGRSTIVSLTASGKQHFNKLAEAHHDWIDEMFAGLDEEHNRQLFDLLGVLRASIVKAGRLEESGNES